MKARALAHGANSKISRKAFEQQLNLLGFRDTGILSDDGSVKIWRRPDGALVALTNKPSIPGYVMLKLLDELGYSGLAIYGGGPGSG